jgi:hypothetical protein
LELSLSLQRGILVIPVLVGGAKIPQGEELRSDLKPLAQRNALTLNDQEFQRDVDQLIQALEKVPGLRKKPVSGGDSWKRELRRRLLRRLAWKAPLIVVLVFFAIWWQWKKESEQPLRTEAQSAAAKSAAAFAGIWSGAITYPWGAKYTEQFFFQPEGDRIFGTAMFLGSKRGIEDGVVVGETVSFRVRFEELMDGVSKVRWNRYEGKIVGSEVLLKVYDDKGNPPVEFKLAKREGFPSAPAPTKP